MLAVEKDAEGVRTSARDDDGSSDEEDEGRGRRSSVEVVAFVRIETEGVLVAVADGFGTSGMQVAGVVARREGIGCSDIERITVDASVGRA